MGVLPLAAEIAVIGAGAAGLCTARHLARCGFRPHIFEQEGFVGGMWHGASQRTWANLSTNLSRFSCCFSDFPWPEGSAIFPSNLQMQTYLENYSSAFLDPSYFRFGCTVTRIERDSTGRKFQIEWMEPMETFTKSATTISPKKDTQQKKKVQLFDGVVVATGFSTTPIWPTINDRNHVTTTPFEGRCLHSSQYHNPLDFQNRTVAVCGSAFSAMEICADIAKFGQPKKVVNVLPNIPWVLPRWLPGLKDSSPSASSSSFWPVDLVLYQRNEDAPKLEQAIVTEQGHQQKHNFLEKLLGRKQQAVLGLPDRSQPALVSISDNYLDLVASHHIEVVRGRIVGCHGRTLTLQTGENVVDVDDFICCTGFKPSLHFMEPGLLETLQWDANDAFSPLVLSYNVLHPDLPRLGFVGMYRGPFLGVMELQARLVAELWSDRITLDSAKLEEALRTSERIRQQILRPQFPRGDVIGYMDSLASLFGMAPNGEWGKRGMWVLPVLYQPDRNLVMDALQVLERDVAAQQEADMSKIALAALLGQWTFARTISHYDPATAMSSSNKLSGVSRQETVTGNIRFSLRDLALGTVLYREDGVLKLPRVDMEVFREYEYVHNPKASALEIYFVEGGKRAHLFLSLRFLKNYNDKEWEANSDHLCVKDLYRGTFTLEWKGIDLACVVMKYRVQGPEKDYESVTELVPA